MNEFRDLFPSRPRSVMLIVWLAFLEVCISRTHACSVEHFRSRWELQCGFPQPSLWHFNMFSRSTGRCKYMINAHLNVFVLIPNTLRCYMPHVGIWWGMSCRSTFIRHFVNTRLRKCISGFINVTFHLFFILKYILHRQSRVILLFLGQFIDRRWLRNH